MKSSWPNIGKLALLFVFIGTVQAAQQQAGDTGTNLALATGQGNVPSVTADELPYQFREYDSSQHGLQLAAANPSARFEDECGQCHGDADEFVRESLTVQDGTLGGRFTEMPLVDFLKTHQKLKQSDIAFYTDFLTRVADEVGLQ